MAVRSRRRTAEGGTRRLAKPPRPFATAVGAIGILSVGCVVGRAAGLHDGSWDDGCDHCQAHHAEDTTSLLQLVHRVEERGREAHPAVGHDGREKPARTPPHIVRLQSSQLVDLAIPGGSLLLAGFALFVKQRMVALLLAYFGMQSGLSLHMKLVMSSTVISKDLHLLGIPAPFLVTGIQQLVILVPMALWSLLRAFAPSGRVGWWPRPLSTRGERTAVLCYAVSFAANIGLNNYSLSLLAVSVNLVIRSCTPMAVAIVEWLVYLCLPLSEGEERPPPLGCGETLVMFAGAVFAGLATVASREMVNAGGTNSAFMVGIGVCCLSMVFAAFNLVFARMLGVKFGINPVDSAVYTSLPTSLILVVPSVTMLHPVEWPGSPWLTDWQVFTKVWQLKPETLSFIVLSGVFAAGFNIVQFMLARELSATHIAFVGNFNKAVTIVLSITLGLEKLPGGLWSDVMVVSLLGNIAMFTVFSVSTADSAHALRRERRKEREVEGHSGANVEDFSCSDTEATTPFSSSRPSAAATDDETSEPAPAMDFASEAPSDCDPSAAPLRC